jgi:hypothetical protein
VCKSTRNLCKWVQVIKNWVHVIEERVQVIDHLVQVIQDWFKWLQSSTNVCKCVKDIQWYVQVGAIH